MGGGSVRAGCSSGSAVDSLRVPELLGSNLGPTPNILRFSSSRSCKLWHGTSITLQILALRYPQIYHSSTILVSDAIRRYLLTASLHNLSKIRRRVVKYVTNGYKT
jgi:hypothetical protein